MAAACVVIPRGVLPVLGSQAAMYWLDGTADKIWTIRALPDRPIPDALARALGDPATHAALTALGAPFTWGSYLCYDPGWGQWTLRRPEAKVPAREA